MKKYYPSKILLIGEYAVLSGSPFLALPYYGYKSSWAHHTDLDPYLPEIIQYLEDQEIDFLDIEQMVTDLNDGVSIQTDIPIGYGLGSSGSVTAAIYDRYILGRVSELDLLRQRLGRIESFFHGESSGLDPLVSYLNVPISSQDGKISKSAEVVLDDNWFLYNSGRNRSTATLIQVYKRKLLQQLFQLSIDQLIQLNQELLESVRSGHTEQILRSIKKISQLQLNHFKEMIPDDVRLIWENGLLDDSYYFKLCGAGGGGFYLGYRNVHHSGQALSLLDTPVIYINRSNVHPKK